MSMPFPIAAFRASCWQSLRATQLICLAVACMLSLLGMPFVTALVYSLWIGNLTSLGTHVGRWSLSWWLARRRGETSAESAAGWPGWGGMSVVIVLSVAIAYPLGSAIAGALMGHGSEALPWRHSPRNWAALFAISLVPAVAGTFYFHAKARLADTQAELARVGQQALETQLKLLESQLEPHMLFNTLANLRALIGVDPARAQAMLDRIIDFLRATLNASRVSQHALSDEFARIADYLALMQIRMGDRLQIALDLPPELAGCQVPPLLLQPLVENAIKHGLEPHRRGGLLRVSAASPDGLQLRLCVSDSGVGLPEAGAHRHTPTAGTGFGLGQVRERLRTLYGERASLSLQAIPEQGTQACVTLPRHEAHCAP
jgi:signal transduction histidine kinase